MDAPKSFRQALDQAGQLLRGLSLGQRILLGGGALLVGATLWIFAGMLDRPHFVTLYSGLQPAEAQELASRLAAKNILYQLSPDGGSVLVPQEQLDAGRLATAAQGLPRNARMGFELFDTPNWAGSDFTDRVNYQRALEGELERTLQALSEVQAARVHLVLPRESLYSEQETPAKAAVILKTRGGALSEQAQIAIPQLVASAVEGLRPEDVTVVDADSNSSLVHLHGPGVLSGDLDQSLAKTLVQTLEPVVGAGHVRASVHVEYDLGTSDDTEETYDPKATATLSEQKSEETAGGAAPAGVPGTTSNLPTGTASVVPVNGENESSRSQSTTYAVSKTIHHTTEPPGRIKRIAAALVVDDAVEVALSGGKQVATRHKRTPEEMKQIQQLAAAAIGLDPQRGDVLSIENLSFQSAPTETPAPPSRMDKIRQLLLAWSGLLRYAGVGALFLIVYFLILRPVKKQLVTAFRELPARAAHAGRESGRAAAVEIELPEGSEEARRATTLKKQLTDKVKAEPAAASRLVQTWMRESGQ